MASGADSYVRAEYAEYKEFARLNLERIYEAVRPKAEGMTEDVARSVAGTLTGEGSTSEGLENEQ